MNHSPVALASPSSCAASAPATWWVICLCAQWCRVCGEYRPLFDALAQTLPQTRFVWVDVEDEDELAGDLDVETFPTLLIADGKHARFLGPLLPQTAVLARLLASLQADALSAPAAPPLAQAVFERVRAAYTI
ncbi:MAG: thioredoxin family protein [Giesbergeria sp.]|nr:thioredoxin family protein [Giesbergeria sp.]